MAKLKKFAIAALALGASTIPTVANDAVGFLGLASVTYGAWLVYRPAGFILGGLFAVATSVLRASRNVS